MNRVELETKLNEGRNRLLAKYAGLSDEQLHRPITQSQHDPENHWSALDHLAHLALVERNFNAMVRRHVAGSPDPVGLMTDKEGKPRTRDEIMAAVHADRLKALLISDLQTSAGLGMIWRGTTTPALREFLLCSRQAFATP